MTRTRLGQTYTIVYNGELYNAPELLRIVRAHGIEPTTRCDTELVLDLYMLFGPECAGMLNGIFAFAVHDEPAMRFTWPGIVSASAAVLCPGAERNRLRLRN
jgi:asparagine synthase (glutamine-hydrolysing)